MEYKSLSTSNPELICTAFNDAFSDYEVPIQMPFEKFVRVGQRRGADYDISLGAYVEKRLAGFVVNAGGMWQGKNTIYDCFTGVIADYQKKGVATQMLEESFLKSKELGFENYLLEVIQTNTKAYELYLKKGFKVTRRFDIYRSELHKIKFIENKVNDFEIKEIENPDWDLFKSFWDIYPSWQNSVDSVKRTHEDFDIFAAFTSDRCVGYIITETKTGDVPQLAVNPHFRKMGIASSLIKRVSEGKGETFKLSFLNIDSNYRPYAEVFKKLEIPIIIKQYEMSKEL